jgi:hypothetical protein
MYQSTLVSVNRFDRRLEFLSRRRAVHLGLHVEKRG